MTLFRDWAAQLLLSDLLPSGAAVICMDPLELPCCVTGLI